VLAFLVIQFDANFGKCILITYSTFALTDKFVSLGFNEVEKLTLGSPENQHVLRRQLLTSSEFPAVMGTCPFNIINDIVENKRKIAPPLQNSRMVEGAQLADTVWRIAETRFDIDVRKVGVFLRSQQCKVGAILRFILVHPDKSVSPFLIKTISSKAGRYWIKRPPVYVRQQAELQAALLGGARSYSVCVFNRETKHIRLFTELFNESSVLPLKAAAEGYWKCARDVGDWPVYLDPQ
jgi:hypothetical protein